jgi:hypothetical protein
VKVEHGPAKILEATHADAPVHPAGLIDEGLGEVVNGAKLDLAGSSQLAHPEPASKDAGGDKGGWPERREAAQTHFRDGGGEDLRSIGRCIGAGRGALGSAEEIIPQLLAGGEELLRRKRGVPKEAWACEVRDWHLANQGETGEEIVDEGVGAWPLDVPEKLLEQGDVEWARAHGAQHSANMRRSGLEKALSLRVEVDGERLNSCQGERPPTEKALWRELLAGRRAIPKEAGGPARS